MWHDIKLLNTLTGIFAGLCVMALLLVGVGWLTQRPMFGLTAITVEAIDQKPLRHVNALTVRAATLARIKGNFFTVDLEVVRKAFENVPWVRRASVRREWPDRLVVSVEEYRPLGVWGEEGRLVSVDGESFTANLAEAEADGKLLTFSGPNGSAQEVVTQYEAISGWLAPLSLKPVEVHLSERYAWTVILDNGVTIKLGRESADASLREKVLRLAGIYRQLAARVQGEIAQVDLRYPNGLALLLAAHPADDAIQQQQ